MARVKSSRPVNHRALTNWVLPAEFQVDSLARALMNTQGPEVNAGPHAHGTNDTRRGFRLNALYDDSDSDGDGDDSDQDVPAPWNRCNHVQGFRVAAMSRDTTGPRDPPAPPNARYRTGRGKPTRNMRCNACGRRGHVARECRQLAMYIWLTKYMDTMMDNNRLAVLDHWDAEQSQAAPDHPR